MKLVISVHGADFFPAGKPRSRNSKPIKSLLCASDSVVAPSQAFLFDFLKVLPELKGKTTAIHNGVDPVGIRPVDIENVASLSNYILCIAHQNEKKGLDVLLKAFALIKDVDASLTLALVGDGPLRDQLEDLSRTLKIQPRTHFLGWKNRDEVARLLAGCKMFVLPSKSEPFGIVIIEAMACKKPVIASCVGGIPEIIDNGKNGIMVEPENPAELAHAIEDLVRHPALRRALGERGYSTVQQRFTHKTMGGNYELLFARLLNVA